jgi:hypothetical protein
MPMWRCPHCGTPQAETARCWVCHRSSTACGTCRHYRKSVAGQLGYCGLDRTRQPLTGDEIRGCWEAWPAGATRTETAPTIGPARPIAEVHRHVEFIEVRGGAASGATAGAAAGAATTLLADVAEAAEAADEQPASTTPYPPDEPGWSLWGELDR